MKKGPFAKSIFETAFQALQAGGAEKGGGVLRVGLVSFPSNGAAWALLAVDRFEEVPEDTRRFLRMALVCRPDHAVVLECLAVAIQRTHGIEPACLVGRKALVSDSRRVNCVNLPAMAGTDQLDLAGTRRLLPRAFMLDRSNADTHFNQSVLDFISGDLGTGWSHYEWRIVGDKVARNHPVCPRCDGVRARRRGFVRQCFAGPGERTLTNRAAKFAEA